MAQGKGSAKKRKKKPDIIIESEQLKAENVGESPAGGINDNPSPSAAELPLHKGAEAGEKPQGEGKKQRDERGRFVKGGTPPPGAGFKPGNVESLKYDPKYPEDMKIFFRQVATEGNYPTFESYADSIGVTVRTLENWCEGYEAFKDAYDVCKNLQRGSLIEGAMLGRFNPTFAKFVAVNCHGMKEKVENEVKGAGGFNISIGYFEGEDEK